MMVSFSDLDESHQARMLWAEDPIYGGRVKLTATAELVRDYREWLALACQHVATGVVCIRASNGAPMYREQCFHCGLPRGQWIPKSKIQNVADIQEVSADKLAEYEHLRFSAWRSIQAKHAHDQLEGGDNEYAQYLQSDVWKQKRKRVLKRANGVCEGCGENPATQVHHLTYAHIQNEFLWELVAICDECHERVHPDDEE
jgi:hypothetical protein